MFEEDVPGGGGAQEEDGNACEDKDENKGVGKAVVLKGRFDMVKGAGQAGF